MKAQIITIGDEILIGQIVDTNSAWMATELNLAGIEVTEIHTIADEVEAIQSTIRKAEAEADLILATGGLGATKDDVTKKAIADLLGVGFYFDHELYEKLSRFFGNRGIPLTEAHRRQCIMNEGMVKLPNDSGTAPGMWFDYESAVLVSMPGVPREMKHLMRDRVLPRMRKRLGARPICHRTLRICGLGETELASRISPLLDAFPPHIKAAYLPRSGELSLRLSASGPSGMPIDALRQEVEEKVVSIAENLGEELVFGYEKDELETVLGRLLQAKGYRMATAESCTGGAIAAKIVSVSGASAYFKGGVVAYSNALKENLLGVSPDTLQQHGAVSEQTVQEMVAGACRRLEVDVALAVSGIAGPGGGTAEKPVGLIWIAVGTEKEQRTKCLRLGPRRKQNIEYASRSALNELRRFILNR